MIVLLAACYTNEKKTNNNTVKSIEIMETTLTIRGLHCNSCVASVEKGIKALDGIKTVVVTLNDSTAVVKYNAYSVNIGDIQKSIEKRGYTVKSVK